MRHLVFTDCHITEKSIPELEQVFTEILRCRKEAPVLICVGDYYDRKNPSAKEIDFGTKWAILFKNTFSKVYMITGNHPDIDGVISGVSYLSYLGITVCEDLYLDGTYYGHFMVKESSCGFNETRTAEELVVNANLSVLGHQHAYQEMANVVHPGSCRYVDFGEVNDKNKKILLVDDCTYIPITLTKTRNMVEVNSTSALYNISSTAMVRIVFNDFNQFLAEADELAKFKSKFFDFKVKMMFDSKPSTINHTVNVNDIITKWVNDISNLDVKEEIIQELKKVGIC